MAELWLNNGQRRAFVRVLIQVFRTHAKLKRLLDERLDKNIEAIAMGDDLEEIVAKVVVDANSTEWAQQLLWAALDEVPRSGPLLEFAASVGYGRPATDLKGELDALERAVNSGSPLIDPVWLVDRLASIQVAVCQVVVPNGGGTGTLVAPDLVLTNYHVIENLLARDIGESFVAQSSCIFDFKKLKGGRAVDPGRPVKLAKNWHVASAPPSDRDSNPRLGEPEPDRLDYALIKLDEPVGGQEVGDLEKATTDASNRGWISIAQPAAPPPNKAPLVIVQHPQLPGDENQQPMKVAIGAMIEESGNRLRYNTSTEHGSSGSMCFDGQMQPVGLHHMGDPNYEPKHRPTYNQGIPLRAIVAHLAVEKGVTLPGAPS